jgi:hypothetical protein
LPQGEKKEKEKKTQKTKQTHKTYQEFPELTDIASIFLHQYSQQECSAFARCISLASKIW